ncbi:MAG: non-homologous end-joining DNA ligase [Candidatus Eremiobacteraeota bacterium]|nr:non-homologous end-joining DNA ligase [Candidatus Eremiobacteraeota bacterium]
MNGRKLTISNFDKILWPQDGITKGDLITYYRTVSPYLIPHLKDRPLTLQRYPNGIEAPSFFEKQAPRGVPDWVTTLAVPSHAQKRSNIDYIVCNDEATLVYCANLASIVLHVWTSRMESLENPDYILFDLDPWEGCSLKTLANVALAFRDLFLEIGVATLVKTSGGTGLHVVVPLEPVYDYEPIKQFAEIAARRIAARHPKETTLERMTARRNKGTVYLDYVQVGRGKTLVPPFAVRARNSAPVSMPLDWSEVEEFSRKRTKEPHSEFEHWTMKNAPKRLEREGDLWGGKFWREQRLEPALKKARTLWGV